MKQSFPFHANACAGAYPDWLDVMLTDKCNGKCPFCIEKDGWHPEKHLNWMDMFGAIMAAGKKNIQLLGGEPSLFEGIGRLITALKIHGRKVYLTTNGSRLGTICSDLAELAGINISIHDSCMLENGRITGIEYLTAGLLRSCIGHLRKRGVSIIRFNCTCIPGHVDSFTEAQKYISFARDMGADSVRFSEVEYCDKYFVSLDEIFGEGYVGGDPFYLGCSSNMSIQGINVNFRRMCGLVCGHRPKPVNPQMVCKKVMYYDGKLYNGWQGPAKEVGKMNQIQVKKTLKRLQTGQITTVEAGRELQSLHEQAVVNHIARIGTPPPRLPESGTSGSGCIRGSGGGRGC